MSTHQSLTCSQQWTEHHSITEPRTKQHCPAYYTASPQEAGDLFEQLIINPTEVHRNLSQNDSLISHCQLEDLTPQVRGYAINHQYHPNRAFDTLVAVPLSNHATRTGGRSSTTQVSQHPTYRTSRNSTMTAVARQNQSKDKKNMAVKKFANPCASTNASESRRTRNLLQPNLRVKPEIDIDNAPSTTHFGPSDDERIELSDSSDEVHAKRRRKRPRLEARQKVMHVSQESELHRRQTASRLRHEHTNQHDMSGTKTCNHISISYELTSNCAASGQKKAPSIIDLSDDVLPEGLDDHKRPKTPVVNHSDEHKSSTREVEYAVLQAKLVEQDDTIAKVTAECQSLQEELKAHRERADKSRDVVAMDYIAIQQLLEKEKEERGKDQQACEQIRRQMATFVSQYEGTQAEGHSEVSVGRLGRINLQTVSTNVSPPEALSPSYYQPLLSPAPSSQFSTVAASEDKDDNVRKMHVTLKKKYDVLHSQARNLVRCTQSMDLQNFGEFGDQLRKLRNLIGT